MRYRLTSSGTARMHHSLNATVSTAVKSTPTKRKGYAKLAQKQVVEGWLSKPCRSGNRPEHAKCFSMRCSCECHKHGRE